MIPDLAKGYVKDLWGKFKKAFSGWQASGNRKEGCTKETNRITLLINGTNNDLEPTPKPCDENVLIKFVDGNHLKFCNGKQSTAYFWGMIEQCGLIFFFLQNLGNFGLVNRKALPTKGGGQGTESSLKIDSIAQSIGAIPSQIQHIMDAFELNQGVQNAKKMLLRCKEHLHQAKLFKYS